MPSPEDDRPRRRPLSKKRVIKWIVIVGLVSWAAMAWGLHRYGLRQHPADQQWDAIVVLGCRVFPDGVPSFALSTRVSLAVRLFEQGRAPVIVLTGGVGEAGVAEAEVAASLAEAQGVPRSALVLESRSTSTEQNAQFAAQATPARRVLVVTDAYHVLRSERVFGRYFDRVRGVGTINPRVWPRVRGALREVIAIAGYAVQGRL